MLWDEVSTTFCPAQNVVGPLAVIVGAVGPAVTSTVIGAEVLVHQLLIPSLVVRVYVPVVPTVMDCVVCPFDQL